MSGPRDQTRIIIGAFVILIGVLALAENLFSVPTRQLIQFWPAVFVLLGAVKISHTRRPSGYLVGGTLMLVGVLMTLNNMGLISFHLRDWWPVLLIAAGLAIMARGRLELRLDAFAQGDAAAARNGSDLNAVAVLSGNKLKVTSQDFRQGEATAVMGGVEIDFRNASIQGEAHLRVFAFWGGIEIKVPSDWSVEPRALAIMGAVDDRTVPASQTPKRLVIDGFVMMGGVGIKN